MNKIEKFLNELIEKHYPKILLNESVVKLAALEGMIITLKIFLGDEYISRKVNWELNFRKLCEELKIDLWLWEWRRWVRND